MTWFSFLRKRNHSAVITIDEITVGLQSCKKYFQRHSKENIYFLPEYEISEEILNIIGSGYNLHPDDFAKIKDACNKIIHLEHYDGSGWHDFKIRLSSLLNQYGYEAQWNKDSGALEILKRKFNKG